MKIIAHRGSSGNAPENTAASMNMAVESGCDGIETDLQLTKDKKVVVFHDWNVNRTTDGTGNIKDLTFEELSKLDNGSWFDEKFKGERIIKLEELLDIVPEDITLNLELKSIGDDFRGLEEEVIKILNTKKRKNNIIISSFNHKVLENVRKLDKDIKLGILYEGYLLNLGKYIENLNLDIYSVHPSCNYINQELVDEVHDLGLKLYAWTVNDKETVVRLEEYGIDGVITNYPSSIY